MTIHGITFVPFVDLHDPKAARPSVETAAAAVRPGGGWVYFAGHGFRHKRFVPSDGPQSPEDMRYVWPNHAWVDSFYVLISTDGRALVPAQRR